MEGHSIISWFAGTFRAYPELAIFISLCIGFKLGPLKIRGIGLGNITETLLAGVMLGQLDIPISADVKSVFFALFVFSIGYGVGPQVVRGLGKEGPKQVLFSVNVVLMSLATSYVCARLAGLNLGYALGLYGGSQTASASLGVATEQINRLAFSVSQTKTYTDDVAVGFAVTYI
jgi:putative transport protein